MIGKVGRQLKSLLWKVSVVEMVAIILLAAQMSLLSYGYVCLLVLVLEIYKKAFISFKSLFCG